MATNNDNNIEILESDVDVQAEEIVPEDAAESVAAAEVPVVKTKKELKKERKEIKKHKKEVKKEAKKHSAKATKFQKFLNAFISIVVIISMLVCCFMAVKTAMNVNNASAPATDNSQETGKDTGPATGNESTGNEATGNESTGNAPSDNTSSDNTSDDNSASNENTDNSAEGNNNASSNEATTPLGSKADVVEYYKTAHAKVLAEAKSVTKTYDNTVNYEEYLEVGGNSSLASVAKTLMNTFMKEVTDPTVFTGADIKTNFPPTNDSSAGLTADMIGDYSVKEEGDNYIIKLSINSTKDKPDLGDYSAHLVSIVKSESVSEAAAGFVEFTGLENRYFAPTVTATINKTSGQMVALETDTPSNMCFSSATVMKIITVKNVGIGLQYIQKWTIEW